MRPPAKPRTDTGSTPGWLKLLITSGLGVTITGIFGLGSVIVQQPDPRCDLAMRVVLDDSLNPGVKKPISDKLTQDAADRLDHCIKDE